MSPRKMAKIELLLDETSHSEIETAKNLNISQQTVSSIQKNKK